MENERDKRGSSFSVESQGLQGAVQIQRDSCDLENNRIDRFATAGIRYKVLGGGSLAGGAGVCSV